MRQGIELTPASLDQIATEATELNDALQTAVSSEKKQLMLPSRLIIMTSLALNPALLWLAENPGPTSYCWDGSCSS